MFSLLTTGLSFLSLIVSPSLAHQLSVISIRLHFSIHLPPPSSLLPLPSRPPSLSTQHPPPHLSSPSFSISSLSFLLISLAAASASNTSIYFYLLSTITKISRLPRPPALLKPSTNQETTPSFLHFLITQPSITPPLAQYHLPFSLPPCIDTCIFPYFRTTNLVPPFHKPITYPFLQAHSSITSSTPPPSLNFRFILTPLPLPNNPSTPIQH